ncbi:MAG: helix-turn-helix domain-containing protein [Patescibacteria group bacterium]|nr:helix-turn-helix domain-containing protein [Patescibacteria group bacterium]
MENIEYLASELTKMGLDKRESMTYLTLLEIKAATAGQIAKKLMISRPTTYRVLKKLEERELISKTRDNGRTRFVASSPDRFLRVLKIQRRRAEEQEREFLRIISILQTKHQLLSSQNEIKIYTGAKEKRLLMEDISSTAADKIRVFFCGRELGEIQKLERIYKNIRKRKSSIKIEEIYPVSVPGSCLKYVARKAVKNIPKLPSRVLVIADRIYAFEKNRGFCVEQKGVIKWFRFLFDYIWNLYVCEAEE